MSDAGQPDEKWRIGTSWGIHVYQGEKGSPGERPVATFHDPADAQRAVDAVNGTADARQNDELREALEKLIHAGVISQWQGSMREDVALTDPRPIVRDLLPVVAAWAETQARERAAEELRKAASGIGAGAGIAGLPLAVKQALGIAGGVLYARADELTTGDPA